jgi:hypothetical protein
MKNPFMKTPVTKLAETSQTPAFEIAIRKRGENPKAATSSPKSQERDNIFSKSRDTREDRGSRQMKASHNSQTFPHAR